MLTMLTVTAAMAYGNRRLAALGTADATHLDVVMVQANLPNDQRGQPQFFADHLSQYLSLTRQAAARPVGLIIWPENAIGFFPEENPRLVARITETLRTLHSTLLTGAPRAGGRPGVAAIYNSAYLFSSDGSIAVYDKRTLLPFVERAPLRADDGPYLPGTVATIFSAAGAPFGVLICYEAVYPDLARELIERGAAFLVNVSNDTWFEAGAGPEQHYEIARFRAVENRVSLVRVTNSGVSGVIDPAGREIARLPVRRAVGQAVGVPIRSGGSLYTRHGDVFAVVCIAVSAVPLLLRLFGRSGT
jgi:apolipoprotein N-acyltransferase